MSRERISQHLVAVEAALASLDPAPSAVDRDRLMFLAGAASARRGRARWLWPSTAAAAAVAAAVLGAMLAVRPAAPPERQIAEIKPHAAPRATFAVGPSVAPAAEPEPMRADYFVLRREVLTRGVEAMPWFRTAPADDVPTLRFGSGRGGSIQRLLDG